jgi:CHAT domain-containing protein
VQPEWQTIQSLLPHQLLVNTDLTYNNLRKNLQKTSFSILHIATHGEFRAQMQGTFLLLWDQLLSVREIESLLQLRTSDASQVLDLLVLSACETARGDAQAPLGLAGIALRAGARSTLATLWQVNDESTAALMGEFYRQYVTQPHVGKAEALRRAQLSLWQNPQRDWSVPFVWGPYVLVGSWF